MYGFNHQFWLTTKMDALILEGKTGKQSILWVKLVKHDSNYIPHEWYLEDDGPLNPLSP